MTSETGKAAFRVTQDLMLSSPFKPGTISALIYQKGNEVVARVHEEKIKKGHAAVAEDAVTRSKNKSIKSLLLALRKTDKAYKDAINNIVICLMDGSRKTIPLAKGHHTNAQDICNMMASAVGLPSSTQCLFALWITELPFELQFKPYYEPIHVYKQWPDIMHKFTRKPLNLPTNARLEYRRQAFTTKQNDRSILDPITIKMLYDECRFNVMSSVYPISVPDAVQLAALDLQLILGDYDPMTNNELFYSEDVLNELVPSHLIQSESVSTWAILIGTTHQVYKGTNNITDLHWLYLKYCQQWPSYGSIFFYGKLFMGSTNELEEQEVPLDLEVVRIGVNMEGLHIIHHQTNVLQYYIPLEHMAWYASEGDRMLYIEYGVEVEPMTITIITPQALLVETVILRFLEMKKEQKDVIELPQSPNIMIEIEPSAYPHDLQPSAPPASIGAQSDDGVISALLQNITLDILSMKSTSVTQDSPQPQLPYTNTSTNTNPTQ